MDADGGGLRFSQGKPRFDLIPPEAIVALANLYGVGGTKYEDRNWERGMSWGKCIRPIFSHLFHWLRGQEYDSETGSHHLIAVAWNALALYTYSVRKIGTDDRSKGAFHAEDLWQEPELKSEQKPVDVAWGEPEPKPHQVTAAECAANVVHRMHAPRPFTYWYVGTPYTKFPAGREAAFIAACKWTSWLARFGLPVYSPIAHSHPIATYGTLDPVDHHFWVKFDAPLVAAATGMIVVKAESWEVSQGMLHEIGEFKKVGKPVVYWDPATSVPVAELGIRAAEWTKGIYNPA